MDLLADRVIELMRDPGAKERIRETAIDMAARAFTSQGRLPLLQDFLELRDVPTPSARSVSAPAVTSRAELAQRLGATAFIGEDEIPVFAEYAGQAVGTLVEIGAGLGASAALMLSNMPASARAFSIDPFVKDSMGELQATAAQCRRNVWRALAAAGKTAAYASWCLYVEPSHRAAHWWCEPIDFLYLDGDHRYEAVKRDFEDWSCHVRPGGVILLHDSRREGNAAEDVFARGWPGPTRVAEELRAKHECIELVDEVFSLTVWRRTGRACTACHNTQ